MLSAAPETQLQAVLPLILRDLPRVRILDRSLERHFPTLAVCWVVAPRAHLAAIRGALRHARYRFMAEEDVVPELRFLGSHGDGWLRQQLVKLAMADVVETPFYVVFDADVICLRPVTVDEFIVGGRAVCATHPMVHGDWYAQSAHILSLPMLTVEFAVTPVILSRAGVRLLMAHLDRVALAARFGIGRRQLLMFAMRWARGMAKRLRPWRLLLLSRSGWTEFSLYFTFVRGMEVFDQFHRIRATPLISPATVWVPSDLHAWRPPSRDDPSPFLVMQSNTGVTPDFIWNALQPILGESEGGHGPGTLTLGTARSLALDQRTAADGSG